MSARTTPVDIQVRGQLLDHAQVRRQLDGSVWLFALVGQPQPSLPILAAQRCGDTPAHDLAAHAKARVLRTGTAVHLRGQALALDRWAREPVLRLCGCSEIVPQHLPLPHHEPTETQRP